jgi:hypothetical protein
MGESAEEHLDLATEIAADPAFTYIARYLTAASDMGFDPAEPDIMRRAMTAGRNAYEKDRRRPGSAAPADVDWGKTHPDIVYYLRQGDLIKIGTSTRLAGRINELGAQGVMVIEMGGSDVETARHRQFAAHRSHRREWFHATPELVDHIFAMRAALEQEVGQPVDEWIRTRVLGRKKELYRPGAHGRKPMTRRELADVSREGFVGLDDAAKLAQVPTARIAQWCARRTLIPAAHSESGMRLFRPSDVLAAAMSIDIRKSSA